MENSSFIENLNFSNEKVVTKVVLETSFSKEIRILLKKGQVMKEHKAPFPIIVHLLEGKIEFGIENNINHLNKGDILSLDANVPHDLKAMEDSIVRLTLSKLDTAARVENVINNS